MICRLNDIEHSKAIKIKLFLTKILIYILFITSSAILSFFIPRIAIAQYSEEETPVYENYTDQKYTKNTFSTLNAIIESLEALQEEVKNKERELEYAQTKEKKTKITNEIIELNGHAKELEKDFESIATSVDLSSGVSEQKRRFDWQEEVQALLGPLIRELKNLTAHPREIEKLRGEIAFYDKRLPVIRTGIRNIQKLIEETKNEKLKNQLTNLEKTWLNKEQHLSNQLTIAKYHLQEKLKGRKSFIESIHRIIRIFILNRGLNLILSILAFILVWLLFNFFRRFFFRDNSTKKLQGYTFYTRLFNVIYHVLKFIAATLALLLVLYVMGDWVLLVLALIFLFGLALAARHTIPRYWEQGKLLLNLGPVKEHERIFYNGIPWEVSSLNFSTYLVNPALKGGMIRLSLKELMGLHSRPYSPDEPWFPCNEMDWVILSDRTHGKVVKQTPEVVELMLLGGSSKTYLTPNFLSQNPVNISNNFRICVTFGIDYKHQAISTAEVPQKLQKVLIEKLTEKGYKDSIINLDVEFKKAASSSLDYKILADFSGKAAEDYYVLSRTIQRISVDACNKYGWIIPFTQITLHNAEKE